MTQPVYAIVTQSNPTSFLARVQDQSGNLITQASATAITVTVWNVETSTQTDTFSPSVSSTIYNTLQTDGRWTTDSIGYNLAINLDSSAFNAGNCRFQVQVAITPQSGSVYRLIAVVETRGIFA
jgi:hypothetical protein